MSGPGGIGSCPLPSHSAFHLHPVFLPPFTCGFFSLNSHFLPRALAGAAVLECVMFFFYTKLFSEPIDTESTSVSPRVEFFSDPLSSLFAMIRPASPSEFPHSLLSRLGDSRLGGNSLLDVLSPRHSPFGLF